MSRPVTKLSLTYCVLSRAMNGKPVSLPIAGVIKKYIDENYKEAKPKELTNTGFSREGFEAMLLDAGISEERMHIIWRAFWEAKTQTRISRGRKIATL